MIGAKKLTRNTWLQVLMSVSMAPSRLPPAAFGEIAALLTSACSAPPSRRWRISEIARVVSAWSARSTWTWSSGPASHGQFSGNGCREQVMTRQPAEEKRITVAWPMPRLAPVRSIVRRGALDELDMEIFQSFGVRDRAGLWSRVGLVPAPPHHGETRCGRAGGTDGRARIRNGKV